MSDRTDILLVEDEPNIAEAVRFILSRAGWQVEVIDDGAKAMPAIRTIRPRLVILDLMLPHRSGREILMELRRETDRALAATRVLLLTAQGQAADTARLAEADAALSKPFANDDLRALVQRLMA
ncbi:response regulator transcription factor [Paracoccus zhejiangensis]|uniref:Two-component system response regulator n=1 Tax=Paracoccus zhejiangensis TaxID=1077935 RepID=A0A2H5EXY9_9RHOB|nr:response regulator [Paracoccus zhejiangensis]AUH64160.1 two-component system response regulator [Paracoccus zhejiangensis]